MTLLFNKNEWFGSIRADLLAGLVVALALIPKAIAFSIIAGVDPKVGLYASFCIAVVISIVGGRPGMISAATGAMALPMVTLVKQYGLEYLLVATLLTGGLQILAGYLRLSELMSFVSQSVVTGFVNALAILIFMAQLPELTNVTWHVYAMTAAGLGIIYLFPYIPKIGRLIPSPLICILVLTAITLIFEIPLRSVGDMGQLPDSLPVFLWPQVPWTLETLQIVLPYSAGLAVVGLFESLMTATIVDDLTDTPSDKNRECKGQGIASIFSGLLGGMAGCAMIGNRVESVIRSLEKPIFVISQAFVEPTSLLLAYDNSENSKKALSYLKDAACFKNLVAHIVFVSDQASESDSFLAYAKEQLSTSGYPDIKTQHLSGAPNKALLDYIEQNNIGLTVMGAFGHHWLRNLLIGSFTSKMLSFSQKPLLLVR